MKTRVHITYLVFVFAFACFATSPSPLAITPAPDGAYPNGNTAEGQNALFALTTGGYNTAAGYFSLFANTNGTFNTAIGAGALDLNTANNNTATGAAALLLNTIGTDNTANGVDALAYNDTGNNNVAIGFTSLFANVTGGDNTAVGTAALGNNSAGFANVAVGLDALAANTTGNNNIGLGYQAGQNLSTGNYNIDIGNGGLDGESDTIRIGATQTQTFVAGIYGVIPAGPDPLPVGVDTNGQLGTIPSSPSTQAVVTASRALNAVFHNIGSRALFVTLTCTMGNGSSEGTMKAVTDGNNPPTTEVAHVASGAVSSVGERDALQLFFIVLPGNYYKVTTVGTVILGIWTEWQ